MVNEASSVQGPSPVKVIGRMIRANCPVGMTTVPEMVVSVQLVTVTCALVPPVGSPHTLRPV